MDIDANKNQNETGANQKADSVSLNSLVIPFGGFEIICPQCKRSDAINLDAFLANDGLLKSVMPLITCQRCDLEWNPKLRTAKSV